MKLSILAISTALLTGSALADGCAMGSALDSAFDSATDCPPEEDFTPLYPEPNPPVLERMIGGLYDQWTPPLSPAQEGAFYQKFSVPWKAHLLGERTFSGPYPACRAQSRVEMVGRQVVNYAVSNSSTGVDSRVDGVQPRHVMETMDTTGELTCWYQWEPDPGRKIWQRGSTVFLHFPPDDMCDQYGQGEMARVQTTGYWPGQMAMMLDAITNVGLVGGPPGPDGRHDLAYVMDNEHPLHTDCFTDGHGIARCDFPVFKSQVENALGQDIDGLVYWTVTTAWGERIKGCWNWGE